eukprot:TRINITY_DN10300_c0_g1_i1.p2 TRINITY_DN10300_c0_g1~~TRINITY_DN10300_c0_g1_i1.p2  ORF type:complete len:123 (+),score=20.60 TRINITY_DN10300_c0_g1_i1:330-698(+)
MLWFTGGVISVAIFTTKDYMEKAAYDREAEQDLGTRLGNQLAVALAITVWTVGLSGLMFFVADKVISIRTEGGATIGGLDYRDFGTSGYPSPKQEKGNSGQVVVSELELKNTEETENKQEGQ